GEDVVLLLRPPDPGDRVEEQRAAVARRQPGQLFARTVQQDRPQSSDLGLHPIRHKVPSTMIESAFTFVHSGKTHLSDHGLVRPSSRTVVIRGQQNRAGGRPVSWFSASSDNRSRLGSGLMTRRAAQPQDNQSPLSWARQRFGSRASRRLIAAGQRAEHRLSNLGPAWHVVEWPGGRAVSATGDRIEQHTGFLAVGPGGVYAVTVVDQGRQRVMLAGDVVQIQGRRPPLVANARRDARKASAALTAAVGTRVPVVPVLTF